MFFWISLIVLWVYFFQEWTTIGPGLLFCLFAMLAETINDGLNCIVKHVRDINERI